MLHLAAQNGFANCQMVFDSLKANGGVPLELIKMIDERAEALDAKANAAA